MKPNPRWLDLLLIVFLIAPVALALAVSDALNGEYPNDER